MKILTIKNLQIKTLPKLLTYDMTFTEARMRDRFFALVQVKADEMEKSRLAICKKFAVKDEKGDPEMKDGKFIFKDGEIEFFEEVNALYDEDCKIDFLPSMVSDIGGLKRLIELSTAILTPTEQMDASAILEAFEQITEEPDIPEKLPESDKAL